MLLRFGEDYFSTVEEGFNRVSDINLFISERAKFMGSDGKLDDLRSVAIAITAICDRLINEDNSDLALTEKLFHNLKTFLGCGLYCVKINEEKIKNRVPGEIDVNKFASPVFYPTGPIAPPELPNFNFQI